VYYSNNERFDTTFGSIKALLMAMDRLLLPRCQTQFIMLSENDSTNHYLANNLDWHNSNATHM